VFLWEKGEGSHRDRPRLFGFGAQFICGFPTMTKLKEVTPSKSYKVKQVNLSLKSNPKAVEADVHETPKNGEICEKLIEMEVCLGAQ
jgi:hypothetical protein